MKKTEEEIRRLRTPRRSVVRSLENLFIKQMRCVVFDRKGRILLNEQNFDQSFRYYLKKISLRKAQLEKEKSMFSTSNVREAKYYG